MTARPVVAPTTPSSVLEGCGKFCKKIDGKLCDKCVEAEVSRRMAEKDVALPRYGEVGGNPSDPEWERLKAERNALLKACDRWEAKLGTMKVERDELLALVRAFGTKEPLSADDEMHLRDKADALLARIDGGAP